MASEHIDIPEHQVEFIRETIASGRYQDISEVARASVLLLEERLAHEERQKEKLRAMLDEALAGGVSDITPEEAWDASEARYLNENA